MFLSYIFTLLCSVLIYYLLIYINDDSSEEIIGGYLASGLVICVILSIFFSIHSNMRTFIILGLTKRAVIRMITEKVLKINSAIVSDPNIRGKILNSVTSDLYVLEVFQAIIFLAALPLTYIIASIIIVIFFGIIGLVGIGISLFQILIIIISDMYLKVKKGEISDSRISKTEFFIESIRAIKINNLESYFLKPIFEDREREINLQKKISRFNSFFTIMCHSGLSLILLAVLGLKSYLEGDLKISEVFFLISVYFFTQIFATHVIFRGIKVFYAIKAVFLRLTDVLTLQEIQNQQQSIISSRSSINGQSHILIIDGEMSWLIENESNEEISNLISNRSSIFVLKAINLDIKSPHLLIVTGPTGSGKSTLLMSILQELNLIRGQIKITGTIAYVDKDAWILEDTVKNNIIIGTPFDNEKYYKILEECELLEDIETFPYKDETLVNENKLSGGQRVRIGLARALYANADILLLDDPLSSSDPVVRKSIFSAIKKASSEKLVIMTSNLSNYFEQADSLLVLDKGISTIYENYEHIRSSVMNQDFLNCQEPKENIKFKLFDPNENKHKGKFIEEKINDVNLKSYQTYTMYGFKSYLTLLFVFILMLIAQATFFFGIYWCQTWAASSDPASNSSLISMSIIVLLTYIMFTCRVFPFFEFLLQSNKILHNNAVLGLSKAYIQYLTAYSSGFYIQRFSKDLSSIDESLINAYYDTISISLYIFATATVVIIIRPFAALLLPFWIAFFWILFRYMNPLLIQLKSVEITVKSPFITTYSSLLEGIVTIRAHEIENIMIKKVEEKSLDNYRAYFALQSVTHFYQFWFLAMINMIFILNVILITFGRSMIEPGLAGFSLAVSFNLLRMTYAFNKSFTELQSQICLAQKLINFAELPQEHESSRLVFKQITKGEIIFANLCMRYHPDSPLALSNLNFHIKGGSTVGIVGRTGSGKSSLQQALFRLIPPESGSIIIDGTNYLLFSLQYLRLSISVLMQSPFLFQASIRDNVDPFHKYSLSSIKEIFKELSLFLALKSDEYLTSKIIGKDIFLSLGQKQLLCLARILLRDNRIVVLDEVFSDIDSEAENIIKKSIQHRLNKSTVIIITHKLRSILECNKVFIIEKGVCVEQGSPKSLYQNENSLFKKFVVLAEIENPYEKIINNC
ncbi:hypothetical protein SteCoe_14835 [Stentor coeruleus]|uniref:ABC transporter domain-containing protein n=1 Tax=Stentor coeruleus TaxID=5963 RepID=A0A1R2C500_9CILI|nr:hypothetical protein SteCoe_14835 [Stentor coeruleus]